MHKCQAPARPALPFPDRRIVRQVVRPCQGAHDGRRRL